jgi:protein-tyrosine-phosphatase
MLDAVGEVLVAVIATIVSALILAWWTGWRGRAGLPSTFRNLLRRFGAGKKTRRLVVFVSAGGTCRDPMAVAIARKLIRDKTPELSGVQVEGRALMKSPSKTEASHAARVAIRDVLGEDLLRDYIPSNITPADIENADLILVMSKNLLQKDVLPKDKTYLFKEFFGLTGDVDDPCPDGRDETTLARYRRTAEEIQSVLESGIQRLNRALGI